MLEPFLYFWNLLDDRKGAYVASFLRAMFCGLLKYVNSTYSIVIISMIYSYRMDLTTIFWFLLIVQTLLALLQIVIYRGQMMVLRKDLWFHQYICHKHWTVVISRIYDNASYEWIIQNASNIPLIQQLNVIHSSLYRILQLLPRVIVSILYTVISALFTLRISAVLALVSFTMQILVVVYVRYTNERSIKLIITIRKMNSQFHQCAANVFGTIFDVVVNTPPDVGKRSVLDYFGKHLRNNTHEFSKKQLIDRRPGIELSAMFYIAHCVLIILFMFASLKNFEGFITLFLWIRSMFTSFDYLLNELMTIFVEMRMLEIDFANLDAFYTATRNTRQIYHQVHLSDTFKIKMRPFLYIYPENTDFRLQLSSELVFAAGDVVLIDGTSGSGKSTLLKILRSIHTTDGILDYCGGADSDWQQLSNGWNNLSTSICFCQQSGNTFVNSNMYNIVSGTFDGATYDRDIVERAMRMAKVPPTLWERENVTPTSVSGGEKQRISIARNIYRILSDDNKRIVILDEIDANINEATSVEVFNAILSLCTNRLVFIVVHSPAIKALEQITQVVLVKNGMITQNGP